MFRFRTLGRIDLTADDGRTVQSVLAQPKRIALLAYLVVASPRGFHRRDTLVGLFWPESDEERARNSLRQSLHFLKRSLEDGMLLGRGDEEVGVDAEQLWCDVHEFERLLAAGRHEQALELYEGEFLPGLYVSQAPEYERWLDRERARLSGAAAAAAWKVVDQRSATGDPAGAIEMARRALELNPLDEAGLRRLLALYDGQGDRAGAVQAYGEFCRLLETDLGIEPSAETRALIETIRTRVEANPAVVVPPSPPPPAAGWAPEDAEPEANGEEEELVGREVPEPAAVGGGPEAGAATVVAPRRRIRVQLAPLRVPARRQGWRSLVAGALLVAFLLGMIGIWNLVQDSLAAVPAEPASGVRVAVLPFAVHGSPGTEYLREGMVDALTSNLEGASDLQAVDRSSVLRRVGDERGEPIDPAAGARFARSLGAELFVTGSVLEVGGNVQVAAALYRVERRPFLLRGRPRPVLVTQGVSEGPRDELLRINDALSTQLLVGYHDDPAGHLAQVAALTSSSYAPLKLFLRGESAVRAGDMSAAQQAFQEAVELDSTFALARYRLAVVADWLGDAALADREAEAALRHAGRLAEHDRRLLQAFASRRRGEVLEADRYYRAVLAAHPDELEAWWMRGELLLRFGPFRGHPIVNAREPLERALFLDPGHRPARRALALVAASQGYLTRADSLFGAWPDNEDALAFSLVRALAISDDPLTGSLEQRLARAGDFALFRVASTAATVSRNLPQSIGVSLLLTSPNRSPYLRRQGHAALATLQLARGSSSGSNIEIARLEQIDPEWAELLRAHLSILPLASISEVELEALRARLLDRPVADVFADSVPTELQVAGAPAITDTRDHLAGLLSARLGDLATVERMIARLERRATAPDASPLVTQWARSLRAQLAYLDRRPEDALALLDFTRTAPLEQATASPFLTLAHARYLRAEVLFQSRRYIEALDAYRSLETGSIYDLAFLAPSYLRQAEILEFLDQHTTAVRYYRQVLQILDNADPRFESILSSARRRLEVLDPQALQ